MKYLLLIHHDEQAWGRLAGPEREQIVEEYLQLARDLTSAGQLRGSAPLHPTSTARSVRIRNGRQLVTDGPFAETREQLGGYFLIDVKDVDEAIGVAARIPAARWGTIEVRGVIEVPEVAPA